MENIVANYVLWLCLCVAVKQNPKFWDKQVWANSANPDLSHVMRKPAFCIPVCENKDADQLRGNCKADQRLCFRYTDTTIPLLSKSEI